MDKLALKEPIKEIVNDVKDAKYFDAHYVIERLFCKYNELYVENLILTNSTIEYYHSELAKLIGELGYKNIGNSFSKNLKGNYNACSCWEK